MNAADFLLIIGVVGSLAVVYFAARSTGRASVERWWQCSWCGCYFNEGDDVSNVPPLTPIKSHGICPGCKAKEIREWSEKKIIK